METIGGFMGRSVSPEFWRTKRVFLTGHTGFKGGWLSLWLQQMGATVCGVSLPPETQPNLFEIAKIDQGLDHHIADVRNIENLQRLIGRFSPDIVIHMAAQPLVRTSYEDPTRTYTTNVVGTLNVLEAARKTPSVRAIVNVTTDKVYENKGLDRGYTEADPLGGRDPYSSSKACSELVSRAYRDSFFADAKIGLATARGGNVIGGGDWSADRLVPDLLRSMDDGSEIEIRHPDATRPWQHVLEPLSGYLVLAEALYEEPEKFAEAWNFGPREEDVKPVRWIVEDLFRLNGQTPQWSADTGNHPYEAKRLQLDILKAETELGWSPRWDIRKALRETLEWHRAWKTGGDMRAFSLGQINRYSGLS